MDPVQLHALKLHGVLLVYYKDLIVMRMNEPSLQVFFSWRLFWWRAPLRGESSPSSSRPPYPGHRAAAQSPWSPRAFPGEGQTLSPPCSATSHCSCTTTYCARWLVELSVLIAAVYHKVQAGLLSMRCVQRPHFSCNPWFTCDKLWI